MRYRKSLIQVRAAKANRMRKVLEGSNIKRARVISDVPGLSGRRILAAPAGTLQGLVKPHHLLWLTLQLKHIVFLGRQIVNPWAH
ncbi:MAG: hypothetical protein C7B45_03080 [Sulfobacillus acidophilus]|uniref:Uncharacterized protein n=1 Tax=Sulfobacillus acidophilus TaxID=53633 RepID=A0A2T2WMT1_9FIRM|nr:MAG: hypothetical protein C7B45_03080 [Sulfobacillus acidophilus]